MLLLLPDPDGGFSFHKMAKQLPDSSLWTNLSVLFTHVQWTGFSIWDLIQPSFIFLVGVSMPFSVAKRRSRGDTRTQIFGHIVLRACVLVLLALIPSIPPTSYIREAWPLLLLAAGLPLIHWVPPRLLANPATRLRLEFGWYAAIVAVSAAWLYLHRYEVGVYSFSYILPQLALASVFAIFLVGRPLKIQMGTALAILAFHWLIFALYPLPGEDTVLSEVGVLPGSEVFAGLFAHWNKNTNVAWAFDVWFLNLFPQSEPYLFDRYGLTTLNFVPTISTMIFGIVAGESLGVDRSKQESRKRLFRMGAAGIVLGFLAAQWACPLIKNLWTPSWTLFTGGLCMTVLALLGRVCEVNTLRFGTVPLAILGTNSILLYTLTMNYRWRILSIPERLFGLTVNAGPLGPLWESATVLLFLWALALLLYRLKIAVRI
jgi:predicted acyltransferase